MPFFSQTSSQALSTCDPRLQAILRETIRHIDFKVLEGHRGEVAQMQAFNARPQKSRLQWPKSKHNKRPSLAVDIAPYPIDWYDTHRFAFLAGYIFRVAYEQGVKLRWGADWDLDGRTRDEHLLDMPHFELLEGP